MKIKVKYLIITLVAAFAVTTQSFSANIPAATKQIAQQGQTTQSATQQAVYPRANALDIVAAPSRYLNKTVTVRGKFDKFSTLGLDYTPAKRSSEDYISFLIQRDDVKDHNIPLSEMKIFLKRAEAEKHIDLNAGDEIEFTGKVFSTALGDVWMDATTFTVISQVTKK